KKVMPDFLQVNFVKDNKFVLNRNFQNGEPFYSQEELYKYYYGNYNVESYGILGRVMAKTRTTTFIYSSLFLHLNSPFLVSQNHLYSIDYLHDIKSVCDKNQANFKLLYIPSPHEIYPKFIPHMDSVFRDLKSYASFPTDIVYSDYIS